MSALTVVSFAVCLVVLIVLMVIFSEWKGEYDEDMHEYEMELQERADRRALDKARKVAGAGDGPGAA